LAKKNQSSPNTMKIFIKLLNDLKDCMKSSFRTLKCFILNSKVWFLKILKMKKTVQFPTTRAGPIRSA
jgi:hypothetical protein